MAVVGDAEALKPVVDEDVPDLVITDIRMLPSYTGEGLDAAVELRQAHPRLAIVALSQYVAQADGAAGRALGPGVSRLQARDLGQLGTARPLIHYSIGLCTLGYVEHPTIEITSPVEAIMAACDANRVPLAQRPLVSVELAAQMARVFKVLANETRLRVLHELVRSEERSVTDLSSAVGLKPQAVSNQLQRLVDQGVVAFRREGSFAYYRLADPCTSALLDLGLCMTEEAEAARGGGKEQRPQ